MAKKIKGKVVYKDISTGFWGIEDEDGNKWRPVDMPEEMQREGHTFELTIEPLEVEMSIFMWGDPVNIIEYNAI